MTEKEIKVQREISDFFKLAEQRAKDKKCALCDTEVLSFSNSHSVPQFVLKRIAQEGKLKNFNDIIGLYNKKNGIKNSWTFHIICPKCENTYFSNYEDEKALIEPPTNKIMAQIALKNSLLMLSKYRRDYYTDLEAIKLGAVIGEVDVLEIMNKLNKKDMNFEIKRSKKIIDKNLKSGFKLIYWEKLDWVVPIAFQSTMCLHKNLDGQILNNIYSESPNERMQFLHIAVFPLKNESVVMMFVHKDDRNYVVFERQFLRLSKEERREYINYLIFLYTEHVLISPKVDSNILKNEKLIQLCAESNGLYLLRSNLVTSSEIPNFLSKEFALQ